jgi:hypothetical protein
MSPMTHRPAMLNHNRASARSILVLIAFLGYCAGPVGAKAPKPPRQTGPEIVATIEQIRSRPDSFAGKQVRLTGQLDECFGWECSLCPETMTDKDRDANRCLELEFRPLMEGTGFGSFEQEGIFRFSSVVLTAKFDPYCWKGRCTDRQTVLMNATVASVTKRRAGASGLWVGSRTTLSPIAGAEAAEMRAAALRAGYPDHPPIKSFTTGGVKPRYVVCWSPPMFDDKDPGKWPSTLESALYVRSNLDLFRCNEVRRIDNQLVVQVL